MIGQHLEEGGAYLKVRGTTCTKFQSFIVFNEHDDIKSYIFQNHLLFLFFHNLNNFSWVSHSYG